MRAKARFRAKIEFSEWIIILYVVYTNLHYRIRWTRIWRQNKDSEYIHNRNMDSDHFRFHARATSEFPFGISRSRWKIRRRILYRILRSSTGFREVYDTDRIHSQEMIKHRENSIELNLAIWMRDILHNGLTAESASHHVRFSCVQNDSKYNSN